MGSIIVPTTATRPSLRTTLCSIAEQVLPARHELILVENRAGGSLLGPPGINSLIGSFERVRYVYEPRQGLHHARHTGARLAQHDLLVYVDDDVDAPEGWIDNMLGPFLDPHVGIVGGPVIPKWETEPPPWLEEMPPIFLSLLDLGDERRDLIWPEGVLGCNMAIRRDVLWKVGGFHPDAMGEGRAKWLRGDGETGLHKKVFEAGFRVVYEPRAWLHHVIPAHRTTTSYFRKRAEIHGISDSYSVIRESAAVRSVVRRLLIYSIVYLVVKLKSLLPYLKWTEHLRLEVNAQYWLGKVRHHLKVLINPSLKKHVTRSEYL